MGVYDPGRPLTDQKTPVLLNDKGRKTPRRGGCAFAEVRQFVNAIFPEGDTEFLDRANRALWISGRANQSAEFHEGLV